jgi:hypothetical protein
LINFLLNGRSVMLEMPRKAGGKIISHMLAAHGGEIFVHTLVTARSVLEDPPSISEGCGGRVTDYRITVTQYSMLVPCYSGLYWFVVSRVQFVGCDSVLCDILMDHSVFILRVKH